MALSSGRRLGPYEILAPIGEGGMGEVYKARDTRLDRIVAIKVLPPHLASNGEARERFEREARTIASLNHPHICTLHDIGNENGTAYLVMEYMEGETLAQRLEKGPLPLEQVLEYAIQVSDALDAAHRHGATHRDIKPGNIMLTKSGTKLLDFGLAKLKEEVNPAIPPDERPTKMSLTEDGRILWTVQYMAPEQVEGKTKEIDGRVDIFSFGAVVYEMVTGKKAFEGQTKASVMTAILKDNPPPMSTLQPMTPPALDHVVKKCLAKERENRWQRAIDLHDELKWLQQSSSQAVAATVAAPKPKPWRWALPWAVGAVGLLIAVLAVVLSYTRNSANTLATRAIRFSIAAPEKSQFAGAPVTPMAVSPDGKQVAFVALGEGGLPQLWVRSLDSLEAKPLPGTEGVNTTAPIFWSPDSRFVGFYAVGKLKKIEVTGGPPQILADLPPAGYSEGTWNREGTIVFAKGLEGLFRVSALGGEAVQITKVDFSRGEFDHRHPYFLPDGKHFLYTINSSQPELQGIYLASLDSKETSRLVNVISQSQYVPPGYLLYVRDGTLVAQPFDAEHLQLAGDPFPITEQVGFNPFNGFAAFSVSDNGVLAYRSGFLGRTQLMWMDRTGRQLGSLGPPGEYLNPRLSPDGKQVAVEGVTSGNRDIWLLEMERGIASRFTFDPAWDYEPLWSPDSSRVLFASNRGRTFGFYQKLTSGAGDEELVFKSSDPGIAPFDWSADGKFLVYNVPVGAVDLWVLPLSGDPRQDGAEGRKPSVFFQSNFQETQAQISPDGRWLAYLSNESGRYEIYIQRFPTAGAKRQVSTNGGVQPRCRRHGSLS